jgi:hypothetical protein
MFWSIFIQSSIFIAAVVLFGGALDWLRDRMGRPPR